MVSSFRMLRVRMSMAHTSNRNPMSPLFFAEVFLFIGFLCIGFFWPLVRQEFNYGSGRLIDVREGPNLLRSFDAARMLTKLGDWSLDAWWGKPVLN